MQRIIAFFALVRGLLKSRLHLVAENLALRQQLAVLQRSAKKPKFSDRDRCFWVWLSRLWSDWKSVLVIVTPTTVVRWHRQGFKYYWRWKSRRKPGRPKVDAEIRQLIRRICKENPLWGSPKIKDELAKLGHEVAKSTVEKYMPRRDKPPSPTWKTFLKNHVADLASVDFFVVPTATFQLLYCFVVLRHDRRRIVHFNVTTNPTCEWVKRQITQAFPFDEAPRYLIRDRDSIYGQAFQDHVKNMGIKEVLIAPQSPWQNPYVERLIGSIRRECLDHFIVLNEVHCKRIVDSYITYYNQARCHQSLDGDSPHGREIMPPQRGAVKAIPYVGGLHHMYVRAAA